jgi:DNA-binding LytR/AlgR family response regulator
VILKFELSDLYCHGFPINERIDNFRQEMSNEVVTLYSENNKERIQISTKNILFIQSSDNYTTIVSDKKGEHQSTLLHSSLTRLEKQIQHPYIIRCHRSFIIDLSKVKSIKGNARGTN